MLLAGGVSGSVAGCNLLESERDQAEDSEMESITTHSERAFGPEYVVETDSEGTIGIVGPDGPLSERFESLPGATDHAFTQTRNVRVSSGTYTYSDALYLPPVSHLHFDDVRLRPEDTHGIRVGDGTEQTDQLLTGRVEVEPDEGDVPATTCLLVDGAKRLQIDGAISLDEGAEEASMAVYGGDEGSWWNNYQGLYVYGRFHQDDPGDGVPNAQNFHNCLFRGPFEVDAGNSLVCRDCWWEGSSNGDAPVRIGGESALLHGRFESVTLQVETDDNVDVMATHESGLSVEENVDRPSFSLTRGDFTRSQAINEVDASATELYQHAHYTEPESAVLQLTQTDDEDGWGNLLRAITSRPEGYYLRGESDRGLDKAIEVNGDYRNEANGRGVVVRTPNGEDDYRIRVDNDGNLLTEEI